MVTAAHQEEVTSVEAQSARHPRSSRLAAHGAKEAESPAWPPFGGSFRFWTAFLENGFVCLATCVRVGVWSGGPPIELCSSYFGGRDSVKASTTIRVSPWCTPAQGKITPMPLAIGGAKSPFTTRRTA